MVVTVTRGITARIGRWILRSPARTAGAGLFGGLVLDDIPVIGPMLDPTSGSDGNAFGTLLSVAILAFVAIAGMLVLDDLGD